MDIISPILDGAAQAAEAVSAAAASIIRAISPGSGSFGDNPDGGLGMAISGAAGVATALLVALVVSVYLRTSYRSTRDILTHGLAAALVFGLIAFAVYDMRHAALAYLGLNAPATVVEFGTDLPETGLVGPRISQSTQPAFPNGRRGI
jgi:hypothetical protein